MFFCLFQGVKGLKQKAENKIWQISSIFVYEKDKKWTFLAQYNFKLYEKDQKAVAT